MKKKIIVTFALIIVALGIGYLITINAIQPILQAISSSTKATPTNIGAKATQVATPKPGIKGPIHALRLDYSDMLTSRTEVGPLQEKIKNSGINLVSLSAGRVEWTYFKWDGHPDSWSSDVKNTGIDYLAEDAVYFGATLHVDAAIDVLSPLYIQKYPQAAAISFDGKPSTNLVSTMQIAEGQFGKSILAMIEAIASSYPVDSISINEMFYRKDGYGPDDLQAYMNMTGFTDWPRTADGQINIDSPSIKNWRSKELDRFIQQAQAIAHKYGKQLLINVGINLDNAENPTIDYGLQPDEVLSHVDRIVIWGFFDLDTIQPQTLENAARYLLQFGQDHVVFVIGLWNKANLPISPEKLTQAVGAIQNGGLANIWITPASLMSDAHWNAVAKLWTPR